MSCVTRRRPPLSPNSHHVGGGAKPSRAATNSAANVAAGAGLVLDDDLLVPNLREAGGDDTGSRVDSATRREWADDAHHLSRRSSRVSSERPRDRRACNPCDEIAPSHAVLPQPQTAPIAI